MRHRAWWFTVVAGAALAAGCVERRFVVTSDPPGAAVFRNGQPLGAAPADDTFVYYGNYRFMLVRDGYETLTVDQYVPPPWYQRWPIDFFSENVIPWTIRDVRRLHYQLQPLQKPNIAELGQRAQQLRNRGMALEPLPEGEPAEPQ